MKVFISVDMEGVCGITSWKEMKNREAKELLTREVNAVIAGIKDGSGQVEEILVCDAHALGDNILVELLDRDAILVRGVPRSHHMLEGLDESFDMLFLVGYHGMAGSWAAQMDHTYSSYSIYNLRVNGECLGETGLSAGFAGDLGVPLVFVSGDQSVEDEAKKLCPGVVTVVTKIGLSRFSARFLHPERVREKLRKGAAKAVKNAVNIKPVVFEKPLRVEIDFVDTAMAKLVSMVPGVEHLGGRTIGFVADNFKVFHRFLQVVTIVARSAKELR